MVGDRRVVEGSAQLGCGPRGAPSRRRAGCRSPRRGRSGRRRAGPPASPGPRRRRRRPCARGWSPKKGRRSGSWAAQGSRSSVRANGVSPAGAAPASASTSRAPPAALKRAPPAGWPWGRGRRACGRARAPARRRAAPAQTHDHGEPPAPRQRRQHPRAGPRRQPAEQQIHQGMTAEEQHEVRHRSGRALGHRHRSRRRRQDQVAHGRHQGIEGTQQRRRHGEREHGEEQPARRAYAHSSGYLRRRAAVAERVGFEPTRARALAVFKTAAFDRSATSPRRKLGHLRDLLPAA